MNSWALSGEVLKHGIKGSKYPKLWVLLSVPAPKDSNITDNKLFINFDLDPNKSSPRGKVGDYIVNKLKSSNFMFVSDVIITKVQVSKKLDNGEWENEEMVGLKGNIKNISLDRNRFEVINSGFASGNIGACSSSDANSRLIIEDKYRNVATGEWKTRDIPVYKANWNAPSDLSGKSTFVEGTVCGVTPSGENKVFVWANKLILTS